MEKAEGLSRGFFMKPKERKLQDLVSVGPATVRDLELLGVRNVAQLARQEPREMYDRLQELTGTKHDPCALDVFSAVVAQARDPYLPDEQKQWWYWSAERKRAHAKK